VDGPTGEPPAGAGEPDHPLGVPDAPPTLPSRTAFLAAFSSIVVAGVLGGVIGYGLVDVSADNASGVELVLGALVGAALAAVGVGIVAVLVLRAQAEWRRTAPETPPDDTPGTV
jgi:hypothetical protein